MKDISVWVVVPNWNGKSDLKKSIPSLLKQSYNCQVVVIDNGSTDGSVAYIRKSWPEVEIVELPKNRGFAGGVNAGIKHAINNNAFYIALLNNDAVADKDWLKNLVKRMQHSSQVGIVTGRLLKTKGAIDSVGEEYSIWGLPYPAGRGQKDTDQFNKARQVTAASGGASLYRASLFKDIGLFDQEFFAYYEDVDIALRAQSRGWQVWYEPSAVAHHQIGGTSSKIRGFTAYHSLKNTYYLYAKNMPARLYWKYLPRFLTSVFLATLLNLVRGNFKAVFVVPLRLILTFPLIAYQRAKIQRARKISVAKFDKLLTHHAPPTSRVLQKLSKTVDRKYR